MRRKPRPSELYTSRPTIGYEYRRQGYVFRAFIGVAVLLNPGEGSSFAATPTQAAASPLAATGYLGFGFGFAP